MSVRRGSHARPSRWSGVVGAAVGLLVALGWSGAAPAQSPAAPLELEEVLDSVRGTHPGLEEAQQVVEERDGKAFAARGGFDPVLSIKGKWAPVGYYPKGHLDALVQQATPLWGISAYAGYRIGLGSYEVYKGDLQTREGGEVRAGINIPLWRNGPIDERRAKIRRTKLERRGAEYELDAAQLFIERDATKAYWAWVAAGKNLEVAQALLEIAKAREAGLTEQVAAGSVRPIVLTDNRRLMLDREAKVVEAELKLQSATLELSLFLRDREQRPVRPGAERLPPGFPGTGLTDLGSLDDAVARALQQRPDALALEVKREAAGVDVRLAANQRGPKADLQAFAARDMGPGLAELQPTELGVGMTVEMALPLRKARGEYRAAQAKAAQVDAKRRGLRDKVEAEVRKAWVSVEAAQQRVGLAQDQRDAAAQLAEAERELLRQGSSDLLAVNLREVAEANAATLEIDALANYHQARADLVAAVGGTL